MSSVPEVLLVEDDPAVLRVLARFLRSKGLKVTSASDSAQGLALLTDRSFDVVISDIDLPGMTGDALWRAALERKPQLSGHFIFVSALPRPPALSDAAVPYLAKPFELNALWSRVEEVLAAAKKDRVAGADQSSY